MKKIKITFEDVPVKKYAHYPRLERTKIAYGTPEEVEQLQVDYIKKIKKIAIRRCLIVIILIALVLFGLAVVGGYTVGAYASPYSRSVTTPPSNSSEYYVLNTNSMKFHLPSCSSVADILPRNKREVRMERKKVISQGYTPCGKCSP